MTLTNEEIVDALRTLAKYAKACNYVCNKGEVQCPFFVNISDSICIPMLADRMLVFQPQLFEASKNDRR